MKMHVLQLSIKTGVKAGGSIHDTGVEYQQVDMCPTWKSECDAGIKKSCAKYKNYKCASFE